MGLATTSETERADAATTNDQTIASMPHLNGLDGVRGLAVIGVLLFHGGFTFAKGGFLGVSTFFTLSGFLITNLLVREFERSSTIDLLLFWGRRLRRLLPAAIAAIALIGVVWWRIGSEVQLSELRGDMLSALGYVANWRMYWSGTSYADLFSDPTPLQHFWSLAIEEQFYLFFPLIVIAAMKLGGRKLLTTICVVAAAASVTAMVLLRDNFDRIYYGTDTRVTELILGVLLALWWAGREQKIADSPKQKVITNTAQIAGLIAFVAILISWNRIPEAWDGLARGGFPVYAVASTVLIFAMTRPGPLTWFFSLSFMRWAGFLSYGLYLYHWPIFLWINEDRTGLSQWPLFGVRMAATIAVSLVSYYLLEMPIRKKKLLRTTKTALPVTAVALSLSVVCAFVVTANPPKVFIPYADVKVGTVYSTDEVYEVLPLSAIPGSSVGGGLYGATVMIGGDSSGVDAQPALAAAFQAAGATKVLMRSGPGIGLVHIPEWRSAWQEAIAVEKPKLIIAMVGLWDFRFVSENGIEAYRPIAREFVQAMTKDGATLVWLPILPGGSNNVDNINELIKSLEAEFPGKLIVPEIDEAFRDENGNYTRTVTDENGVTYLLRKPDNWHLCPDGAERLASIVLRDLIQAGVSLPPVRGWEDGPWRQSREYTDGGAPCAPIS
ncbi:MAG: hypothetical protein RLZZ31_239 [Actinomycetota bacterium]|jgi:peptidoglycan/LPS O-acetylase OafA/YrhL